MKPELPVSSAERRDIPNDRMFPMTLSVEYKVCGSEVNGPDGGCQAGSGYTRYISSSRVEFEPDRLLRVGQDLDLSIAWPVKLNDAAGLTLRVRGRVVRANQAFVELKTERYEFHTRLLYKTA